MTIKRDEALPSGASKVIREQTFSKYSDMLAEKRSILAKNGFSSMDSGLIECQFCGMAKKIDDVQHFDDGSLKKLHHPTCKMAKIVQNFDVENPICQITIIEDQSHSWIDYSQRKMNWWIKIFVICICVIVICFVLFLIFEKAFKFL